MKGYQQQSDLQDEALLIFSQIKECYAEQIDLLTDLKRQVFQDSTLDQQLRSRLRITIESLLIDLNEEVFAISEELAKSFTFERNKQLLGAKAQEFQQRQHMLMKKIKDSIDNNPSAKAIRRKERIQQQQSSPPQKDLSTFGAGTLESNRPKAQQILPTQIHTVKDPSPKIHKKIQRQNSAQKPIHQSNSKQPKRKDPVIEMFQAQSTRNQKKSPGIPLRRKEFSNSFQMGPLLQEERSGSRSMKRSQSAKKRLNFKQDSSRKAFDSLTNNQNNRRTGGAGIDDFESFLSKKLKKRNSASKENFIEPTKTSIDAQTLEVFIQDFAFMKTRMIQMQKRMQETEERQKEVEDVVNKLKTDNVRLSADVRILTNEQTEMLATIRNIEKKNSHLQQENQVLRRIVEGQRDLKGAESNMPLAVPDKEASPPRLNSTFHGLPERKTSPFSSFLQKHRSFSNIGEDFKPHNASSSDFINQSNCHPLRQKSPQRDINGSWTGTLERDVRQSSQKQLWPPGQEQINPSMTKLQTHFSQGQSRLNSNPLSIRGGGDSGLPPIGVSHSLTRLHQTPINDELTPTRQSQSRLPTYQGYQTTAAVLNQTTGSERVTRQRLTPNSLNSSKAENKGDLSDWVLERIGSRKQQ